MDPEGTPAPRYLRRRLVLPPGAPLPASVRWLPMGLFPERGIEPLPRGAAGAILYAMTPPEAEGFVPPWAVQCEALLFGGRPTKSATGAVWAARKGSCSKRRSPRTRPDSSCAKAR